MNGPIIDHILRSEEWKMKPPFRVPTSTTALPFLTLTKATTRDAGEDVDLVPRREGDAPGRRSDELRIDKHVHELAELAGLVHDAIADSREGRVEARDEHREIRRIEEHLVLAAGIGEQGGRDPHEHARSGQVLWRDAGFQSI